MARIGENCEFAQCPHQTDVTPVTITVPQQIATTTFATSTLATSTPENTEPAPSKNTPDQPDISKKTIPTIPVSPQKTANPSLTNKVVSIISSAVTTVETKTSNIVSKIIDTIVSSPKNNFSEEKYSVNNGAIVSSDGTVLYTIPPSITASLNHTSSNTESHTVNVIPVGEVPPIIGAIPVVDLPGKYYLSESSFGNPEACEFSNKIFILDTKTNEVTLMYEENNHTLSRDDQRACNSEIYLLATENEKLIIKYHTVGTNSLCDSPWSEPDKTWNLDVTKLSMGMKKYPIPEDLYNKAEQVENTCRAELPQ